MRYILPIVLLVLIWSVYALLPTLYYKFIKKPVFPNKVQQTKLSANRQHKLLNPSLRDSKEAESRSIQIMNQEKFDLEAIDSKIDQKTIYLTFDDGPDKEYTQQMLRLIKKHNLQLCLWNILPGDWKLSTTPKQLLEKMEQSQEGSILCLHDSVEGTGGEQGATNNTLATLQQWIPDMKTRGFELAYKG